MEINSEFDDYCDDFGPNAWSSHGSQSSFLNQLDYIPLVSTITGIARIAFGFIQAVIGLLVIPIEVLVGVCSQKNRQFTLVNGLAHVVRGAVATYPIFGNIALYLYDRSRLFA